MKEAVMRKHAEEHREAAGRAGGIRGEVAHHGGGEGGDAPAEEDGEVGGDDAGEDLVGVGGLVPVAVEEAAHLAGLGDAVLVGVEGHVLARRRGWNKRQMSE